ncbi:tRNA (5-methylaminomethyl-2-thiouridine)(34)-methyltransferase MnmD [Roseivirga sp. E12]|uniref:tRNA (5-methylaminomethyl-2-thiouridine)(34)-methyltransferase MnmD n=1 Tax=Roseivirga sp. E12 TaxID=2819237 RepID=UPI001ABCF694|nr:tRNA (5-methylaminomethyl-2-thiouridine)(34)-methyltransferase MnmD [Roseivirga sp. E12]MBO3699214.1 tRNA (5-methylaminomethyl-2-thiouridine)(34)-methyltransferase MnmD [Roseivirga sp. E12]
MTSSIRIIQTEDGSQSLYNESLNETYHSTHGALTESQYVFIKQGLDLLVERGDKKISIFEVGFGTGLNALLVQKYAHEHTDLDISFTTLEPFPLSSKLISELRYETLIDGVVQSDFEKLHNCSWRVEHQVLENFIFTKYNSTLEEFDTNEKVNLVFYDAFAPSKQAEMWEKALLSKVCALLSDGGVFVTYCARGQLKRDLNSLGLMVETLPGPPGKKEMVRAVKSST